MSDEEYDEFGNLIGDAFDSDAESLDNSIVQEELGYRDAPDSDDESDQELHTENSKKRVHFESENGTRNGKSDEEAASSTDLIKAEPSSALPITYVTSQPVDEPVIKPVDDRKIKIEISEERSDRYPKLKYSYEYLTQLSKDVPSRIRNLAVVGNLHSGKTTFLDNLILSTYLASEAQHKCQSRKSQRILDNHKLEVERGMTLKASPITLLLPDLKQKSHILNIIDTPGHFNFYNESNISIDHSEGVVLVVDCVEGFTSRDKQIVTTVLQKNKPLILVINKIDRLILELNLPVSDSFHKLKYIIDDVNDYIQNHEFHFQNSYKDQIISPAQNNVLFSSSLFSFNFSLLTFAELYLSQNNIEHVDPVMFSKRLWSDYYDSNKNTFTKNSNLPSAFETFVLEPIYKIITYTLTLDLEDNKLSKLLWNNFGVKLSKKQYKQDHQDLLKDIFNAVFGEFSGFVECAKELPDAETNNNTLTFDSPLYAKVIALLESPDTQKFYSLVRIYKGSIKLGQRVKVVGDNFLEDDENYKIETVDGIFIPFGGYKLPTQEAGPGSLVIVEGVDSIITKNATIFNESFENGSIQDIHLNNSTTKFYEKSVFKVAIEPANPSELPKLLQGIRKVNKSYVSCNVNVEDSGEIVLYGPGELYLDCILHDLRYFFTDDLEIKVSDPMAKFSETCIDRSSAKIGITTKFNSISVTAEPVNDNKLLKYIELGNINLSQPVKTMSKILKSEFGWDALAARSVWTFGPDDLQHPNILMDDTLESETDKKLLYSVKDSITSGFKWSVNEGPLCNEPIRGTKFKILDAVINGSAIQRSNAQIIPMTRRACYTGFLTATPRLMEPIYTIHITCTERCFPILRNLLKSRRGYLESEFPIPATPLFEVKAFVPVIDSVGLESDIRLHTQGQAMCFFDFERWDIVPGDPLDEDVYLPTLKPAPTESLARDFVLKTRKRKGLTGDITLKKYIDGELYEKLKEKGVVI